MLEGEASPQSTMYATFGVFGSVAESWAMTDSGALPWPFTTISERTIGEGTGVGVLVGVGVFVGDGVTVALAVADGVSVAVAVSSGVGVLVALVVALDGV